MRTKRFFGRLGATMLVILLALPTVLLPHHPVLAFQNERAISISLPSFWRDMMDLDAIIADF